MGEPQSLKAAPLVEVYCLLNHLGSSNETVSTKTNDGQTVEIELNALPFKTLSSIPIL